MTAVLDDVTMPTYRRWPVEFLSGEGAWLRDTSGDRYLDLMAGIAVASVGHCHPKVTAAISSQAASLVHVSNLFLTRPQAELAGGLADMTGGMKAFFGNSGAEAVECAIKLARRWGGSRRTIVAAEKGFHGRTLGALAATGQLDKQEPFEPLPLGFEHVPYDDIPALEAALDDEVCAVILEVIQGEAGVLVPQSGYLTEVRRLCIEAGVLLILDEIQTGLGRTGRLFAYEHEGVAPDILCLGKALAGGLPMGACLARPEIADAFQLGDHGSTFGGGPVPSSAAIAVLEVIDEEGLCERAKVAGERLMKGLEAIAPHGSVVRGMGAMIGLELPDGGARSVVEACLERKVLVNDIGDKVVRFVPPLVISDDEIDHGLGKLEEVFDAI
ncbi:MAG: acetylornithine transaminase [Actinobacteria bacterium]|nr:acetylornithine transaminase [Actinomycetota bacterium]